MKNSAWWLGAWSNTIGVRFDSSIFAFEGPLLERAVAEHKILEHVNDVGAFGGDVRDFVLSLLPGDARVIRRAKEPGTRDGLAVIYAFESGVASVTTSSGGQVSFHALTLDAGLADRMRQVGASLKKPDKTGRVYMIADDGEGDLYLRSIGIGSARFQSDNYSQEAVDAYGRIVAELRSDTPKGRIAILDGPPGTGKTFFVRALIDAVKEATFVLVPPEMVKQLASPKFVPMIASYRGPFVFVIEDGDSCVRKRQDQGGGNGDADAVSAMLNLGDGIIGAALDIRIVVTTNTPRDMLDPAITREGRLLDLVSFGSFTTDRAIRLLRHLTKDGVDGSHFAGWQPTLAEIYATARVCGWKPAPVKHQEGED